MTFSFCVMIRSLNVDIQGEVHGAEKDRFLEIFHPLRSTVAVSYTHLTLPTTR